MTTKTIDITRLEHRARQALAKLPWWSTNDLPPGYQRPGVYRTLLDGLAGELPHDVATSRGYREAKAAVARWAAADNLAREAAELYHHPVIQEVAGSPANLQWLLQHPDEARKLLISHSIEHPEAYRDRASPLSRALAGLAEFETFDETYSSGPEQASSAEQTPGEQSSSGAKRVPSQPPAGSSPGPNRATKPPAAPTTYAGLIAKQKLTPAEHAQLLRLAADRFAEEDDEPAAAPQAPPNPVNQEWARRIDRYERTHPLAPEDDPLADLPDSYFYGDDK